MKAQIFRVFVLLTVVAAYVASAFAEDLDAALEAQKKKTPHRTYSDYALVEDQNLAVPYTQTEEEKVLDKKLKEIEEKADTAASAPSSLRSGPRPVAPAPKPAENKNWLTATVPSNEDAVSPTNALEEAWLMREMERQREIKEKDAVAAKKKELTEKTLREKEKNKQQDNPLQLDRLKQYQVDPIKTISGKNDKDFGGPDYMTPQSGTPDPLAAIRTTPKVERSIAPPLFSPEAARLSSSVEQDQFSSIRSPSLTPNASVAPSLSPQLHTLGTGFTTPNTGFTTPKAAPLTPIEMIKKSSPINRPDPFAEERMPQMKSNIWE